MSINCNIRQALVCASNHIRIRKHIVINIRNRIRLFHISVASRINNDCGLDILTPCDDIGHGTHTMGTMVATDTNVLLGVAPDAQWIGCRNMEDGWGAPNTYLECFEWFLAGIL